MESLSLTEGKCSELAWFVSPVRAHELPHLDLGCLCWAHLVPLQLLAQAGGSAHIQNCSALPGSPQPWLCLGGASSGLGRAICDHQALPPAGPLSEIRFPIDKLTKKPKGFAFITYMIPEHAVKALAELDGQVFQVQQLMLFLSFGPQLVGMFVGNVAGSSLLRFVKKVQSLLQVPLVAWLGLSSSAGTKTLVEVGKEL